MRCLMLGCGHTPPKRQIWLPGEEEEEADWTTLDINADCHPDVVFDLNMVSRAGQMLPFPEGYFDEIHAYEVLEHFGELGYYKGFFREWREFWRLLRPGGHFFGSTPEPKAIFSDPGHTRCVSFAMLEHLTRGYYENLGKSHVTDYRKLVDPCWWETMGVSFKDNTMIFGMEKVGTDERSAA